MRSEFCTAVLLGLASAIGGSMTGAICAAQQPLPVCLTLQDAIQKGLEANLNVLVAGTRVDEAEGTRERRLSAALLPRVSAQTYANVQNRDLRAFGISAPGLLWGRFRITISAFTRSKILSICKATVD
jgi:outer membrane protein TolC